MRIICVDEHVWPMSIHCECGVSYGIEFPSEMVIKQGDEAAYVRCPICKAEHRIVPSLIPKVIRECIPHEASKGIMSFHD